MHARSREIAADGGPLSGFDDHVAQRQVRRRQQPCRDTPVDPHRRAQQGAGPCLRRSAQMLPVHKSGHTQRCAHQHRGKCRQARQYAAKIEHVRYDLPVKPGMIKADSPPCYPAS